MTDREVSLGDLAARVRAGAEAAPPDRRYLVGIAGPPAAGKSTLSVLLRDELNRTTPGFAEIAPMDGFHKTNAELVAVGALHRKGEPDTFDVAAFVAALRRVRQQPVGWPTFDHANPDPLPDGVVFSAQKVAIVEGNYLLLDDADGQRWSLVGDLLNEVWFIDADLRSLENRLMRRHLDAGKPPDQARTKVDESDLPNALLVRRERSLADLLLREHGGRYLVGDD